MKKLATAAVGTSPGTLLYTVPTDYKTDVHDVTFGNTTAAPIRFALHFVPTGGSVTDDNMFVPDVEVPGNTFVQWSGCQTLNPGDFIQAVASGAGVTVHISGNEYRRGSTV